MDLMLSSGRKLKVPLEQLGLQDFSVQSIKNKPHPID